MNSFELLQKGVFVSKLKRNLSKVGTTEAHIFMYRFKNPLKQNMFWRQDLYSFHGLWSGTYCVGRLNSSLFLWRFANKKHLTLLIHLKWSLVTLRIILSENYCLVESTLENINSHYSLVGVNIIHWITSN